MNRDRRLTGSLRGQTDEVTAPAGFELNNPWAASAYNRLNQALLTITDGNAFFLIIYE
jgi:hypothetical protein